MEQKPLFFLCYDEDKLVFHAFIDVCMTCCNPSRRRKNQATLHPACLARRGKKETQLSFHLKTSDIPRRDATLDPPIFAALPD
mmetsp:Transcript_25181/g.49210  ORF Transcript_25181/g.49210 Transcript_25181/m.49210 type:complete len:83 (-) Transcript_25181:1547-1795(-)